MAQKVNVKIVTVNQGEYMPLPENKKLVVAGPASVENTRWDTGRLDVRIVEGTTAPVEFAIVKKWKRLSWEV